MLESNKLSPAEFLRETLICWLRISDDKITTLDCIKELLKAEYRSDSGPKECDICLDRSRFGRINVVSAKEIRGEANLIILCLEINKEVLNYHPRNDVRDLIKSLPVNVTKIDLCAFSTISETTFTQKFSVYLYSHQFICN